MIVRVLTLLAPLALAACDDTAPPTDATPIDTAMTRDSATACTMVDECPCFSNDDCPLGTRCHAASPSSVYCEPGPRGATPAGGTCTGEHDCESALCVDGADTLRCSKICMENTECPAELPRCLGGIGICARAI